MRGGTGLEYPVEFIKTRRIEGYLYTYVRFMITYLAAMMSVNQSIQNRSQVNSTSRAAKLE